MNAPPLLVSFPSIEAFFQAIPPTLRSEHEINIRSLVEKGLPPVVSIRLLSVLFGVSPQFVGSLCYRPEKNYRVFTIKKGNKKRQIQAPKVALKIFQKWIGTHLALSVQLPKDVYGFVPGKSTFDAAKIHCEAEWVYSLDIRDFFPSITGDKVASAVKELGYSDKGIQIIKNFCTLNDRLVQGSPASPVLSNIVFIPFDIKLKNIASDFGVRYTRYADDLAFSGKGSPPEELINSVRNCILSGGWKIALEKERVTKLPLRLKVYGLLVHGAIPRLTKGYRNKIRAYKHLIEKNQTNLQNLDKINGHIAYSNFISRQNY
jgi:hypothetical protein